MQDVDYQVFTQKGENPQGGRPQEIYKLSVSCLEYFIARKVRPVFEVYRQVFHAVINGDVEMRQTINGDYLILVGQRMKELELKIELDKPKVEIIDATNINLLT